ncbi:mechanosensitive ion channel family protein [Candidatus Kaiserbacteria bacterium]|nr:mechanosensitive ion channel family protein [Candidatus Kaiserbacteria bacterium]
MEDLFFDNAYEGYLFLGNSVEAYILALGIFIALFVVFRLLQWGILKRLESAVKRTKTDIDDTFVEVVKSLKPAFYYILAVYFALRSLVFPELLESIIDAVIIVVLAYQAVTALHILLDYTLKRRAEKEGGETKKALRSLGVFLKWGLWAVAILTVLSNLGVNVTSLVAGLGIGGIAIALAVQNILSDLFSSFAIYFDKPFEVGDFIIVGEHSGTVEKIGIKTTRLRALQGEEIVISNKELTSARIQNLKKMKERRVTFTFGVVYGTSLKAFRKIPEFVREIFAGLAPSARIDRVHFKKLSESSLDFEVVYYVPTREYLEYMNLQEKLNLKLIERFREEKIEFAYPTQTLHLTR